MPTDSAACWRNCNLRAVYYGVNSDFLFRRPSVLPAAVEIGVPPPPLQRLPLAHVTDHGGGQKCITSSNCGPAMKTSAVS